MMPWEHAIVAYIGYSLLVHVAYREPPSSTGTAIVVFASLLPDLVDKPLAWGFGLWETGHALGHSAFVAVPTSVVVLWLASTRGRLRAGLAFAIGYCTHLVADVVPETIRTGESTTHRVLWPLRRGGDGYDTGFREELLVNLDEYARWLAAEAVSGDPEPYVFLLLVLAGFGATLWVYDGMPMARDLYRAARRAVRRVS